MTNHLEKENDYLEDKNIVPNCPMLNYIDVDQMYISVYLLLMMKKMD